MTIGGGGGIQRLPGSYATGVPAEVLVVGSPPLAAARADPLLTAAERARCAAFRREVDAARHATGRLLARSTAARWFGVAPERVGVVPDLDATSRGCPRLTVDGRRADAYLSIAHAGEVVLVAVSARPCGIDVEVVADVEPVVGSDVIYAPPELAALAAAQDPVLLAARWWTAKESVLKALEVGLGVDPPLIDVRRDLVTVAAAPPYTSTRSTWRLHAVDVPAGHIATLAVPA